MKNHSLKYLLGVAFLVCTSCYHTYAQNLHLDAFAINGVDYLQASGVNSWNTLHFYSKPTGGECLLKRTSNGNKLLIPTHTFKSVPAFVLNTDNHKTATSRDKIFDIDEDISVESGFNLKLECHSSIKVLVYYGWEPDKVNTLLVKEQSMVSGQSGFIYSPLSHLDSSDWVYIRYEIVNSFDHRLIYASPSKDISNSKFRIYPTLADNHINLVVSNNLKSEEIEIISANGQLMLKDEISEINSQIDISMLPRGCYFLRFNEKPWLDSKKFMIE